VPDTPRTCARDLVGEARELVDHRVHGLADPLELALDRLALDLERHLLRQVALGHGVDHARNLRRGPDEVVDQRVDRLDRLLPGAAHRPERRALGHAALAADHAADPLELARHAHVLVDQLVEGAVQLGDHAAAAGREALAEVAVARGDQRVEERLEQARVDMAVAVGGRLGRGALRRPGRGTARCLRGAPARLPLLRHSVSFVQVRLNPRRRVPS
jgi:hypothetical protein